MYVYRIWNSTAAAINDRRKINRLSIDFNERKKYTIHTQIEIG